jgi:hypothetical protein
MNAYIEKPIMLGELYNIPADYVIGYELFAGKDFYTERDL